MRTERCDGTGANTPEDDLSDLAVDRRSRLRKRMNIELNFPTNFEGLVLGCIDADFCK